MGALVKAGSCPKCSSTNTVIDVRKGDVVDGVQQYVAFGHCYCCGFDDMKLKGDDLNLVVEVAKKSFSTVYLVDGSKVAGMPTMSDLASDISSLLKLVCESHDCYDCPVKEFPSSHIGVKCRDQNESDCRKTLQKAYPALTDPF